MFTEQTRDIDVGFLVNPVLRFSSVSDQLLGDPIAEFNDSSNVLPLWIREQSLQAPLDPPGSVQMAFGLHPTFLCFSYRKRGETLFL